MAKLLPVMRSEALLLLDVKSVNFDGDLYLAKKTERGRREGAFTSCTSKRLSPPRCQGSYFLRLNLVPVASYG